MHVPSATPIGSSPHTRGAQHGPGPFGTYRRIIPAYAGSTIKSGFGAIKDGDHPRIRGEHERPPAPAGGLPGSSPHTRGALMGVEAGDTQSRIIPAYAGSTREKKTAA